MITLITFFGSRAPRTVNDDFSQLKCPTRPDPTTKPQPQFAIEGPADWNSWNIILRVPSGPND